jgi:hypothetical protein
MHILSSQNKPPWKYSKKTLPSDVVGRLLITRPQSALKMGKVSETRVIDKGIWA